MPKTFWTKFFDILIIDPTTHNFKPSDIARRAIAETQISGTARIRPNADGTFRYDPKGQPATTLGVNDRHGNLVDVVAWPEDPRQWWLRRGDQTPILGARALAMAAWHGESVKLYCTPKGWLRAIERAGNFPARAEISERSFGYAEDEVDHWIEERLAARKVQAA